MANLTRDEVIQRIRFAMGVMGIKDHLPKLDECMDYGKISQHDIKEAGGLKKLSKIMGLPLSNQKEKVEHEYDGIFSMSDVTPSGAFDMQRESGKLYADIQKAATLSEVPEIDVSAYAGMKTFTERKKDEIRER